MPHLICCDVATMVTPPLTRCKRLGSRFIRITLILHKHTHTYSSRHITHGLKEWVPCSDGVPHSNDSSSGSETRHRRHDSCLGPRVVSVRVRTRIYIMLECICCLLVFVGRRRRQQVVPRHVLEPPYQCAIRTAAANQMPYMAYCRFALLITIA